MDRKKILLLIHIPVWIIVGIVALYIGYEAYTGVTASFVFFTMLRLTVWFFVSFYGFYSVLIPNYLAKGKIKAFAVYSVLFIMVMPPVLMLMAYITGTMPDNFAEIFKKTGFQMIFVHAVGTLFFGLLGSYYRFGIDWFKNIQLKNELENIKIQSELESLKSRLNPHFLFNTLNNIDALMQADREKASAAIAQLSDLLRYVVYDAANETIAIQKELDTVEKYIDLERLRILNPEKVSFKNSVDRTFPVPPMLFMPFIENAFKHSNLNHPNQRIDVSFSGNNHELLFRCVNNTSDHGETKEKGIGLELVRKRLNLTFPGKHSLHTEQHNDEYSVILKISFAGD